MYPASLSSSYSHLQYMCHSLAADVGATGAYSSAGTGTVLVSCSEGIPGEGLTSRVGLKE